MPITALAVYSHQSRSATGIRAAAREAGLTVRDLAQDPASIDVVPSAGLAWRCPPALAVYMRERGSPLPVTGASAHWFAALPADLTGRGLQVLTVQQLLDQGVELPTVQMVKLAELKDRHLPATRVQDVHQACTVVADLQPGTRLLVADRWLDCQSEYRVLAVSALAGPTWAGCVRASWPTSA